MYVSMALRLNECCLQRSTTASGPNSGFSSLTSSNTERSEADKPATAGWGGE